MKNVTCRAPRNFVKISPSVIPARPQFNPTLRTGRRRASRNSRWLRNEFSSQSDLIAAGQLGETMYEV